MPVRFRRHDLLKIILAMEGFLLIVAFTWAHLAGVDLVSNLKPDGAAPILIGLGAGVLMSLTSFLFTRLSQALGGRLKFLSFFDEFVRKTLIPIFSQVNTMDILLIASVSGFAEELFFRGVLQAQLGIVIASIIFGLFHFTGPRYLFYVIWAALAGYFMGLLLDRFHTLWVPILAHATNNFISIAMLRFRVGYRDTSEES